jgi:EAL domain-containing protein (putative c-di-GMP-specific phosphodiesterase class I)
LVGVDCGIGSDPQTWIKQCRLRSPEGAAYQAHDLPLMQALDGKVIRDFDVLANGSAGDALFTATARPMIGAEGEQLGAVVVFEDVTEQRVRDAKVRQEIRDTGLAVDVESAIDAKRLLLYSQPIIDLSTGETVLEELLVRMRAADGTISGPASFLAAAERHGTITKLDAWVFGEAVQIASGGRPLTVNVSARTVSTPSYLEDVESLLERSEIDPALITLEITETAVVSDLVQVSRFADRIDRIGCHFALDDFGTGYAALTYLKHLPVRYLKIDVDFIRDLEHNPRSRRVVNGVVALAASLNHRTIAEGVEDVAVLDRLRTVGVDLAQGFAVGEPAPVTVTA